MPKTAKSFVVSNKACTPTTTTGGFVVLVVSYYSFSLFFIDNCREVVFILKKDPILIKNPLKTIIKTGKDR